MLVVISKKVAAQKGPKVVFGLSVRMVLVVVIPAVWKVGAKVKQLKSRKDRRKHPKCDKIFGIEKELEDVESHCHQQDLPDGHILADKADVPDQKIARNMVIRILRSGNMSVVGMMPGKQPRVKIKREQDGRNPTGQVVAFFIRRNDPVHRVVSRDEKPSVKMHLDQNPKINPRARPGNGQLEQDRK